MILKLERTAGIFLKADTNMNTYTLESVETECYDDIAEFFDMVSFSFEDNSFIEIEYPEDSEYKKFVFSNGNMQVIDGNSVVIWDSYCTDAQAKDYFYIKDSHESEMVRDMLDQLNIEYVSEDSSLNLLKDVIVESRLKYGFAVYTKDGEKMEVTDEFIEKVRKEMCDSCDQFFEFNFLITY